MSQIFHSAPILLAPGSIILPGNWGRILRSFGERHPRWSFEQELERVRLASFPSKPSRLAACYGCPDEATIRLFSERNRTGDIPPVLYRVEIVDPSQSLHVGDWAIVRPDERYGEKFETFAQRYWSNARTYHQDDRPDIRCTEVVTSSPVRVLQTID